jgi:hypothetical protein
MRGSQQKRPVTASKHDWFATLIAASDFNGHFRYLLGPLLPEFILEKCSFANSMLSE